MPVYEPFKATGLLSAGTNVTITGTGTKASPYVVAATSGGGTNATNLSTTAAPTTITINSDTGTDATIAAADATNAGLLLPAEKTKLSNTSGTNTGDQDLSSYATTSALSSYVPTTRTVNGSALSANVTLTQDDIGDGTTNKAYTAAEKTKLSGVATSATANDTDANLKARANHTGTQTASTISDFSTAADARITAATSTGTGSLVRATSPTINSPVINNPTGFLTGAAKITVGTTAPSSPTTGDLWVDAT